MKRYLALLLSILLTGLTACTTNKTVQGDKVEQDDTSFTINYLGEEYSFDKKVENIVLASLEGMEDAAALGIDAVGVLEIAGEVPKYLGDNFKDAALIGDKKSPNFEAILSVNPDLIVGSSKFPDETKAQLNKIAVTLPYSHISSDWKANLKALGELTDKLDEANKLISDYEEKVVGAKEGFLNEYENVLVIRIRKGLMNIYPANVYLNPVLYEDLGLKVPEIVGKAEAQAEITLETLAEVNPDAIFLQFEGSENTDAPEALNELLENPIFKSTKASVNGKIFVNTVDPLAQGGTAWSKVRFLDIVIENLSK